MNQIPVKELAPGQSFDQHFLLAAAQLLTTKTGKPFGALRLSDASAQVDAKVWDQAPELIEPLSVGQVVRAAGRVESYQNRAQLVIQALAPAGPGAPGPAEFLPASPIPAAVLERRLGALLARVRQPELAALLADLTDPGAEPGRSLRVAPAAKAAHHAYARGLLEHTVSVAEAALALAPRYPELDLDLLVAGALIHDLGKTAELTLGPPIDYTTEGRLEGHVALGLRMLEGRLATRPDFPAVLAGQLRHLILSHHGLYEFGSPKKPKTPEAFALNMLDDLDAKLFMLRQAREEATEGQEFSGYNRLLERVLYLGPRTWETAEEATAAEAIPEAAPAAEPAYAHVPEPEPVAVSEPMAVADPVDVEPPSPAESAPGEPLAPQTTTPEPPERDEAPAPKKRGRKAAAPAPTEAEPEPPQTPGLFG